MIEFATQSDKSELMDVFIESFIGEEEFAKWMFASVWKAENTLIVRQNKRIVSALYILPQKIAVRENEFSAYYIYGVGTIVAARGRGHAANLLNEVSCIARARRIDAVFLIPAEKSLFDYYAKMGYENYFYVDEQKIMRKPLSEGYKLVKMQAEHFEKMIDIYNAAMTGRTHILRTDESFHIMLKTYGEDNSHVLIKDSQVVAYAFCEKKCGAQYVLEALGKDAQVIAQALGDVLRMPADNEQKPLGMMIDINSRIPQGGAAPYCNLLFN